MTVFHNCTPYILSFTKINELVLIILISGFKLEIFSRFMMSVSPLQKNKCKFFRSLKRCTQQTYTIKNCDTYQVALQHHSVNEKWWEKLNSPFNDKLTTKNYYKSQHLTLQIPLKMVLFSACFILSDQGCSKQMVSYSKQLSGENC